MIYPEIVHSNANAVNITDIDTCYENNPENSLQSSASSTLNSITYVSKTNTSITFDIWYLNSGNVNNILYKYDKSHTKTWTYLLGREGKPAGTTQRYTASGLIPGAVYTFKVMSYDTASASWQEATITVQTTGSKTPSATQTSSTTSSFTLSVNFPSEGAWGNRLQYYDGNSWVDTTGNDLYATSGSYTVNSVVPGKSYQISMRYYDHMTETWQDGFSFYAGATMPQESIQTYTYSNMEFKFDQWFSDIFSSGRLSRFLTKTNAAYDIAHNLVGGNKPYNGAKMGMNTSRTMATNVEGMSGNPITWSFFNATYPVAPDHVLKMNYLNADMTETPIHDIGHNFQKYTWNFEAEALTILNIYYYMVTTNEKMAISNQTIAFTGAQYKTYIKSYANRIDGHINYDAAMAQNAYSPYSLAWTLANIADTIGWDAFKSTFAYFDSLSSSEVPNTSLGKLNLFLSQLQDFSGKDVFGMLTAKERTVYAAKFGGNLSYVEGKTTIVLIPGIMGSRLYYDGDRKWEPSLVEGVTGSWAPFLYSNENGVPDYTLDYTPLTGDYGAKDTYQTIYTYLNNPANFPKSKYNFKFFTYDWRLSSTTNADRLASFLSNDSKVVIVAHSMGGLVASAYLAKGTTIQNKVDKLITFGTPYLGSAKAIHVFETGGMFGGINGVFTSNEIKTLSANTTSVYELLPTSRYSTYLRTVDWSTGDSILTNLTHTQAQNLLGTQSWAKKTNGSVKPMLANSTAFHNSLMTGSSHIANAFGAYYIIGTGVATPDVIIYNVTDGLSNGYVGYLEVSNGDGTVIVNSAKNLSGSGQSFPVDHTELVSDTAALDYMKSVILGTATQSQANSISIAGRETETWETKSTNISLVLQGVQNLGIYDAKGNKLLQDADTIYRANDDGTCTKVGYIWCLDIDRQRYQYVLEPGEYHFDEIELDQSIQADALFISFENGLYKFKEHYTNFTAIDNIKLSVSTEDCVIVDKATLAEVAPSNIATTQELHELNAGK